MAGSKKIEMDAPVQVTHPTDDKQSFTGTMFNPDHAEGVVLVSDTNGKLRGVPSDWVSAAPQAEADAPGKDE